MSTDTPTTAERLPAIPTPADETLWWSRTLDRLNTVERARLAGLIARVAEAEAERNTAEQQVLDLMGEVRGVREELWAARSSAAEAEARRDDALRLAQAAQAVVEAADAWARANEAYVEAPGDIDLTVALGAADTALGEAVAAWREGRDA